MLFIQYCVIRSSGSVTLAPGALQTGLLLLLLFFFYPRYQLLLLLLKKVEFSVSHCVINTANYASHSVKLLSLLTGKLHKVQI